MTATSLPFVQVDAFADRPFTGNPAAVMLLDDWLPDDLLAAIAAEHNLSETAFLVANPTAESDFDLRWFTPEVEVAMCGHATLASGHAMLTAGHGANGTVRFATRQAGVLTVTQDGDGYRMSLPAWVASEAALPDFTSAMGGQPVAAWSHPQRYWLFVYESAEAVAALTPDFAALRATGNILCIATAVGDGHASGADVVSRVFAPGAGIDEDPVTGSAHAILTPYWAARLGRDNFSAFQASKRGGHLGCRLEGDRVVLTGRCATVIDGVLRL